MKVAENVECPDLAVGENVAKLILLRETDRIDPEACLRFIQVQPLVGGQHCHEDLLFPL